jgi:hypothetical protein
MPPWFSFFKGFRIGLKNYKNLFLLGYFFFLKLQLLKSLERLTAYEY